MVSNNSTTAKEQEILQIFKYIDTDNSGFLNKDELRTALAALGKMMSDADFDKWYKKLDQNNDGIIS